MSVTLMFAIEILPSNPANMGTLVNSQYVKQKKNKNTCFNYLKSNFKTISAQWQYEIWLVGQIEIEVKSETKKKSQYFRRAIIFSNFKTGIFKTWEHPL